MAGSCEHSNEPLDSTEGGEFLDWLSGHRILIKDFAPCSKLAVAIKIESRNKIKLKMS
jgi:hypothetical protein